MTKHFQFGDLVLYTGPTVRGTNILYDRVYTVEISNEARTCLSFQSTNCGEVSTSNLRLWAPAKNPKIEVVEVTADAGIRTKQTNPKELVGDTKVPLWLLSGTAKVAWALAQFAGLVKYGAWNWRVSGVRSSTYLSAIERHLEAYKNGEEFDPEDGTQHLGNVMACCAIILDAQACGKLNDDRPPVATGYREALRAAQANMLTLTTKYKDRDVVHAYAQN